MSNRYSDILATLPPDWPVLSLSDAAETITSGGTPSRAVPAYWGGSTPWVTPGELTHLRMKYLSETREKITAQGLAASGATLLPRDSLMVTTRATLGSVALAARATSTNQGFKSVVFGKSGDPSFYFHFFRILLPELIRRSSGTTFLEISAKQFGQIVIPVPPVSEQRRIAEILDTADEAIRSTERLIAKLRQVKSGLLLDLIGNDSSSWSTARLGEVASTYSGGTPPRAISGFYGGGIPWVKSGEVNHSSISGTEETITPAAFQASSVRWVPPGVPLVAMYGATAGVVSWTKIRLTTNQAVLAVVPRTSRMIPRWLYWLLEQSAPRIMASVQGSGQPNLSKNIIDSFKFRIPSVAEQVKVATVLDAHDVLLAAEQSMLRKLNSQKQGLMTALLTGQVRVDARENGPG